MGGPTRCASGARAVARAIRAGPNRGESTTASRLDGLKSFVKFLKVLLLVFGGIAVFVGAFTIFNTLSITVAQRSRELALLRALGATRRQVLRSVVVEALAIGRSPRRSASWPGLGLASC